MPTLHPLRPNNQNLPSDPNPRLPPLTPAREEVSQQLYTTLSKATTEMTKGDRKASNRLQDIYILLHTAEFKIKKAERWNGEFEIGGKAVPVPREVDVAFHKVKEAMSELQYHLFMDLYPIDCYHIKEASP